MGEWDKHTHTHVQVNTNGDLSFGEPYTATGRQTFPTFSPPLIAPFFNDVDITNGGTIYYRQTSDPMDIIAVIATLQTLPIVLPFTPTLLFIATWDRVAPFSSVGSPSDRNTFQVILATDGFTSTVIFNYGDIQWGERAEIGFSAGDGVGFLRVPSSGTNATLDIETQSNVGVPGQFIYRVDGMFRTKIMFITSRKLHFCDLFFSLQIFKHRSLPQTSPQQHLLQMLHLLSQ